MLRQNTRGTDNAPITHKEWYGQCCDNTQGVALARQGQHANSSHPLIHGLNLANDVQLRLKLLASIQLTKELPQTGNREQMLKDRTFQRLANRTVLERFFDWLDKGLDTGQALKRLESSFA